MQDRLKFRIFDKENKEIVYPKGEEETVEIDGNGKLVGIDTFGLWIGGLNCIPSQCTGLKDKTGNLIYEGDIVKINETYPDYSAMDVFYKKQNFVVEYFQPRAVYLLKPSEYKDNSGDGIWDLSPDFYEFLNWKPTGKLEENVLQGIEIIGNIFQNPDLMEGVNNGK